MSAYAWHRTLGLILSIVGGLVLATAAALVYQSIPRATILGAVLSNVCLLATIAAVVAGFLFASEKGDALIDRRKNRGLCLASGAESQPVAPREVVSARNRQRADDPGRQIHPLDSCPRRPAASRSQPPHPAPAFTSYPDPLSKSQRWIGQ